MSTFITLGVIFTFIFGSFITIYIVVSSYYYQGLLGSKLEEALGFKDGAAYLRVGRKLYSAVCLKDVTLDGVFHSAGLRTGDVVPSMSHTDLFRYLHKNRGKTIELTVVDGGPGPPFCERPRRTFRIHVPPRNDAT